MVEEDAIAGVEVVGFAVVHDRPVGEDLGAGIGASGPERRGLLLGNFLHQSKHLAGTGLVKAWLNAYVPDGFQQADAAGASDIRRVFSRIKAHADMALGGKIIHFVWLHLGNQPDQAAAVGQVPVVQVQMIKGKVGASLDSIQTRAVSAALAANDAVNFVAFPEEQLGQIRTVLTADASDESAFRHEYGREAG